MRLEQCSFEFFSKFLPITEMKILSVRDPPSTSPGSWSKNGPKTARTKLVKLWTPLESAQMREPLAPLQQSFCQSISLSSFMMILIKGIRDTQTYSYPDDVDFATEEFCLKFCHKIAFPGSIPNRTSLF